MVSHRRRHSGKLRRRDYSDNFSIADGKAVGSSRSYHRVLASCYVHFEVAARCRRANGVDYALNVQFEHGPLGISEHNDGNLTAYQVLLVTDIFVSRQEHIEPALFRRPQQFPVCHSIPSQILRSLDHMAFEKWADRGWGSVVEEHQHQRAS